jgi:hypothetical protein
VFVDVLLPVAALAGLGELLAGHVMTLHDDLFLLTPVRIELGTT